MLLLERGLMITSCCSEGPGCINMSRSNAAKVYAGSLQQKFGIDLSTFSLFLPFHNKILFRLTTPRTWAWRKAQRVREGSQMYSGRPLIFLSASCKLSVGTDLGGLNIEILCVEYLQEQRVVRTNSFLNCLVWEAFVPFFFPPSRYFSFS